MLSLRAEGHPKEAKPGAEDVSSHMTGKFLMGDGKLTLQALVYTLPGATVQLEGLYTLDGKKFDFTGKVRTEAKLSQMVASRWKSWALKSSRSLLSQTRSRGGNSGEGDWDQHGPQIRPGYRTQEQEVRLSFRARTRYAASGGFNHCRSAHELQPETHSTLAVRQLPEADARRTIRSTPPKENTQTAPRPASAAALQTPDLVLQVGCRSCLAMRTRPLSNDVHVPVM